MTKEFEKGLDNFLDSVEYDQVSDSIYTLVRAAYLAGYRAAGGVEPIPQNIIQLELDPSTGFSKAK